MNNLEDMLNSVIKHPYFGTVMRYSIPLCYLGLGVNSIQICDDLYHYHFHEEDISMARASGLALTTALMIGYEIGGNSLKKMRNNRL